MNTPLELDRSWGNSLNKVGRVQTGVLLADGKEALLLAHNEFPDPPRWYRVRLDTGEVLSNTLMPSLKFRVDDVSPDGKRALLLPLLQVLELPDEVLWKQKKGYGTAFFVDNATHVLAQTAQGELQYFNHKGTLLWSFRGYAPFSVDHGEKFVACVGPRNTLYVLTLNTGAPRTSWNVDSSWSASLAQATRRGSVATVYRKEKKLLLSRWDLDKRRPAWTHTGEAGTAVALWIDEQEDAVYLFTAEGSVRVHRWSDGALQYLHPLTENLQGVRFSKDGTRALLWSEYSFSLWDHVAKREVRFDVGHDHSVSIVVSSHDARRVASVGQGAKCVEVWNDSDTHEWVFEADVPWYQLGPSFSRDGRSLQVFSKNGLLAWNLEDGSSSVIDASLTDTQELLCSENERLCWLRRATSPAHTLFDRVSQRVLFQSNQTALKRAVSGNAACVLSPTSTKESIEVLWFEEENNFEPTVVKMECDATEFAFDPKVYSVFVADGSLLLIPDAWASWLVMDARTGKQSTRFRTQGASAQTSPHRKWLVAKPSDGTLLFWKLPSFVLAGELSLKQEHINSYTISGDGMWLIVGTKRGFVHRYRLPT